MKGILIEPGKGPVVTTLPDTLQGIEAWLLDRLKDTEVRV